MWQIISQIIWKAPVNIQKDITLFQIIWLLKLHFPQYVQNKITSVRALLPSWNKLKSTIPISFEATLTEICLDQINPLSKIKKGC